MSNKGDDCYFYFYSTCTKGDSCAFRHCEAALGNETVCSLWQDGCCFRQICKYRHMAIEKRRSEIPCYWENQPSGCQKGNCAFHHTKGRFVDGVFMPPSKTQLLKPEPCEADPQTSQLSQAPSMLSVAPTPQLRGVKKIEATENVPSPTHPPVVINAADDDEDDDDQFSEEGDELKNSNQQHLSQGGHQGTRVVSTRKSATPQKGGDLNFGIKTLDEIKYKKQKDREVPMDGVMAYSNALGSCDNVISERNVPVVRTITFSNNDPPTRHISLAQRLGKRQTFPMDSPLVASGGERLNPVRKTLSERFGKKITLSTDSPDTQPKKVQISRLLKDRLGLPAEQNSTETERAANPTADFRVKTLQEIRQEKANQKHEQKATGLKDRVKIKSKLFSAPQLPIHRKSFLDIQVEKRIRQLKDEVQKEENKADAIDDKEVETGVNQGDEAPGNVINLFETKQKLGGQPSFNWNIRGEIGIKRNLISDIIPNNLDTKKPSSVSLKEKFVSSPPIHQIRVKTLEEIRQEKALRRQQAIKSESVESVSQPQAPTNCKNIFRLSKMLDKPKVNVVPAVVKNISPVKRKRQENTIVAEVKPLSSAVTHAGMERTPILPVVEPYAPKEPLVNQPKSLKHSPQLTAPVPGSPSTIQPPTKRRRISTSPGESSMPAVDDFDDLIWGISDGNLEVEMDLDPSKDEDDLLMELSEILDS
ncbi:zinc finger CCCH domain-containing protein 11A isoform X2 [Mixophyes fleayi]|uniref:zinc finger CCCH domain-containing protein 11A isoform X2 n=1 Tax=Mixophyes fleayi TaxID=3061075 RepID=UPI003F4D8901